MFRNIRRLHNDTTVYAHVRAAHDFMNGENPNPLQYYDNPLRKSIDNLAREAEQMFTGTALDFILDATAHIVYGRFRVEDEYATERAYLTNLPLFSEDPKEAEAFIDEYRVLSLLPDLHKVRSRFVDLACSPELRGMLEAAMMVVHNC